MEVDERMHSGDAKIAEMVRTGSRNGKGEEEGADLLPLPFRSIFWEFFFSRAGWATIIIYIDISVITY